jgi:S-formylglutathione hydrolase FrmB
MGAGALTTRRSMLTLLLAALLAAATLAGIGAAAPARAASSVPAPGGIACTAPGTPLTVVVGKVACQELTSNLLGTGVAAPFEYYVPPQCDPALGVKCPVLYLLHGFGGDYTEMLDTPGTTSSAWIQAETKQPPAGFESAPWKYADPKTWVPAPKPLGIILVAPLGQTLPGGYGPQAGLDSYYADWNPRFAAGGDEQRYNTPPPKFESYLVDELAPFVEANLPAGSGRDYRAIAGVSLGGYGSYKLGLQHPDEWTTMMSVSGAHNFLFAPAPQPGTVTLPAGVQPPVPVTYEPLPAVTGPAASAPLPSQVGTFITALDAFGDPAADQAYFRGNMPPDLAMNGRAYDKKGAQVFGIDGFVNDMTPAQTLSGDSSAVQSDVSSEPFENIVFPMNIDMEAALAQQSVANTFAIHQGNHSDRYRNAWFPGLEEFAFGRLAHPDGTSAAPMPPKVFDYRTIDRDFDIWKWHFHVDRQPVEFLTLRSVSCDGLTLQGSGKVQVSVPPSCQTGVGGRSTFDVDLGPAQATDEPAGLGAMPVYGKTVHVTLASLHH